VRFVFDAANLTAILGEEVDHSRVDVPLLMLYDSRVTECAHLLADECLRPAGSDRLYGEALTTAFCAALFSAWKGEISTCYHSGQFQWQLRLSIEYIEDNFAQDVSLSVLAPTPVYCNLNLPRVQSIDWFTALSSAVAGSYTSCPRAPDEELVTALHGRNSDRIFRPESLHESI